jgi:hypothetical protein
VVFVVGDVTDPVDRVLDVPVTADPVGQVLGSGLVDSEVGDRVHGFGGDAFRLVEAVPAATDL